MLDYIIRPIRMEDEVFVQEIRTMPGVMENTTATYSERIERQEQVHKSFGINDHVFVAETTLPGGVKKVIGWTGLFAESKPRRRHIGGLAVMVDREYQGKGVGTSLMKTLLDLADNWLMLVRLELSVFSENEGAVRLYERLGFVKEGLLRKSTINNGKYADEYIMARIKE